MVDDEGSTTFFSLSTEELALIYFSINYPDQGWDLLKAAYTDLTEKEQAIFGTAARNSLLSKDLCAITEDGIIALPEELEQAVFPLVNFSKILNLYRVVENEPTYWTVFINHDRDFTFHTTPSTAVHQILHGSLAELPEMVAAFFELDNSPSGNNQTIEIGDKTPVKLILDTFDGAEGLGLDLLIAAGWPEEFAPQFLEDVVSQQDWGLIAKKETDYKTYLEKSGQLPDEMIIYVRGPNRLWLISYRDNPDKVVESVQLATQKILHNQIGSVLV